jgi:D-alanyl-D-alanine dipeptidase
LAEIDMGSPVNASPEQSNGACYTAADNLDPTAKANRATLGAALGDAGLVNYPTEWWHWEHDRVLTCRSSGAGSGAWLAEVETSL